MEQRGITLTGAGVEAVNVVYMIADPTSSNNQRVWNTLDATLTIYHDSDYGWRITNSGRTEVYYTESTPSSSYIDPWDAEYELGANGVNPLPTWTTYDDPNIQIVIGTPETSTDPDTGEKVTRTTTTYYNAITNDSFTSVQIERETYSYVIAPVERYDTVNLVLGKIYRFSFVKDFQALGYINDTEAEDYSILRGIYRVDRILSYKEVLAGGIDLYANLYVPASIPESVFKQDEPNFQNTMFYKLTDPRNEDIVIYMPLSFIDGTPDGSVAQYDKLLLAIDLGIFSSTDMLADMIDIFKDLLEARWGIKADGYQFAEDAEIVQFQRYDSVWLTTADYEDTELVRQDVIDNAQTALLDKLFGSEMNKLQAENAVLKTKIAAYEDILTNRT